MSIASGPSARLPKQLTGTTAYTVGQIDRTNRRERRRRIQLCILKSINFVLHRYWFLDINMTLVWLAILCKSFLLDRSLLKTIACSHYGKQTQLM